MDIQISKLVVVDTQFAKIGETFVYFVWTQLSEVTFIE
jgi:hypothetical protein